MNIRAEVAGDRRFIFELNSVAFETPAEARLVDLLRDQASPHVSLVAVENGVILGHIMFSPVTLSGHPELRIIGLAPMAVAAARQNSGIGSELVRTGLESCRELGFVAAVVLGHPKFYPRFGFSPSTEYGIDSEYEVPADVFMAMELVDEALSEKKGRIAYHDAFREL